MNDKYKMPDYVSPLVSEIKDILNTARANVARCQQQASEYLLEHRMGSH